ncbi:MAG: ATP-dependent helicase [Gammaproteobacteria bacterium]|nr:ATP-dependent helicase [Gammaproteobacteria bacterium]
MTSVSSFSLRRLNSRQQLAAAYDIGESDGAGSAIEAGTSRPLLVLAGAGTGKTTTIAHRVANLVRSGVSGNRILLMTFSRRAAREMIHRAAQVVSATAATRPASARPSVKIPWAGTYHSIAHRLLRLYARHVGLQPGFSILDRSDAADMLDVCRQELRLSDKHKRFPRKDACIDIYSRCVNRQATIKDVTTRDFPWCQNWQDELRELFKAYTALKQSSLSLDYDDLLLYWYYMMQEGWLAEEVANKFEHILVDEYQDTNILQAAILKKLSPEGSGVTVVGDDAQSIYSFRAAEVANIRNFPGQYSGKVKVIDLQENYRSHQAILDFANVLMSDSKQPYCRTLQAQKGTGDKPFYVTVEDDFCQARYITEQILKNREDGLQLMQQAVLFRNSHHSDALEVELARRNIPFVKYGGLKFLESQHIKDVMCLLRWSVNPKDRLAGFRCMQLLPGVGPALAARAWQFLMANDARFVALSDFKLPKSRQPEWLQLCGILRHCSGVPSLLSNLNEIVQWYRPYLERRFPDFAVRWPDLEQLQQIAHAYRDAEHFLSDLALDPPLASGDHAGDPLKDEDYLVLSTIHSAKGQEWNSVYIMNVVDGSFPSEFATGDDNLIEEERRLLYVAATRAKDQLHLISPLRFYLPQQQRHGSKHVYGAQSRFMTATLLEVCERRFYGESQHRADQVHAVEQIDLPARISELW